MWDKVQEELEELKVELAKGDKENSTQELGDFIFSVINAARLYKLNRIMRWRKPTRSLSAVSTT